MPRTKKRKNHAVSDDERDLMLFWWTVYDGNLSRTAKKVSELTGINRSPKVVMDVSRRNNFATLSHVVRDEVNKEFYGNDTPGMGRMLKIAADLLEMDELLINDCKKYLQGFRRGTKIEDIPQLLSVLKYVNSNVNNMSGKKDLKSDSFHAIAEKARPLIGVTMEQVLKDMNEDEKLNVIGEVIEQQIEIILKHQGDDTSNRIKNRKKERKLIDL